MFVTLGEGLMRMSAWLNALPRWLMAPLALSLVSGIAALDIANGPYTSLAVFYIIPVALGAWFGGRWIGLAVAVASGMAWYGGGWLVEGAFQSPFLFVWNIVFRSAFFAVLGVLVLAVRSLLEEQRRLAMTDPLTGLPNARAFRERAELEIARSRRSRSPLTLVFIDCDGFKAVNDTLGHRVGDELLATLGGLIRKAVRNTDMAARIGGDEFAILLCDTPPHAAKRVVAQLHESVGEAMRARGWDVTLSMGVKSFALAAAPLEVLLDHADRLLYEAKRSGRNRVIYDLADEPASAA